MRIWIVSGFVGYIYSITMVFQRSECSSYSCDGSFRKLCSPTCICAFTTLPMVTAHVPTLCTLSATCLRFPHRCCFCVRSQRCTKRCLRSQRSRRTVRVQNPEKKWGALGACHDLNALNAHIFFSRWCSSNVYLRRPPIFIVVNYVLRRWNDRRFLGGANCVFLGFLC
jgi:hypothetical protein